MEPGVYRLSSEEYHKDPCDTPSLSRSVIVDLDYKCPAKAAFNHPKLNLNFKPDEDKKFDLGSVAHDLLLEGLEIAEVIDAEDWRKNDTKQKRDDARARNKIPLLVKEYMVAKDMVLVAEQQIWACEELGIKNHLKLEGDPELSFIWQEPTGAWCRVRPDWISKDRKLILDYKTTRQSANPDEVDRTVTNMHMDIQEAFYRRGVRAIEGSNPKFIFIFQEVEPPYLCSSIGLLPQFQETGKSKCDYGIFIWEECMRTGKWPSYPNRVCWIEPKPWALAAWETRAMEIGV